MAQISESAIVHSIEWYKEDLLQVLREEKYLLKGDLFSSRDASYEVAADYKIEKSRWGTYQWMVIRVRGQEIYLAFEYYQGATEDQEDESPEFDSVDDLFEVNPVQVTTTNWKKI